MPSETRNDGNKKAALEPFFYLSISLSFLKLLNFGVEVFNDYLEQFHIALQRDPLPASRYTRAVLRIGCPAAAKRVD